jgi:hypothetical protein
VQDTILGAAARVDGMPRRGEALNTTNPFDSETTMRVAAADPYTKAGWVVFSAGWVAIALIFLFGPALAPLLGLRSNNTEVFDVVVNVAAIMPILLIPLSLILMNIGGRRALKRIELRHSICIACGYNRTGLKPEKTCPKCGITAET